jgi:1-acyl-sn-glycerol-3-phosphate acyltransferase
VRRVYWFGWFFCRSVFRWILGVRYVDWEKVPLEGALVVAPNHRSYLDPPLVGCGVPRELHFFAKAELFNVPLLGSVIRAYNALPVKRGEADRRALSISLEVVRQGGGLVVFPEGTRSRSADYLAPKLGTAMIAARGGARITPVFVATAGGGSTLVRSMLRIRRIEVRYGDPIDVPAAGGAKGERYQALTDEVMRRIRALDAMTRR